MRYLSIVALALVVAPAIATPAFADTVGSCAEVTDPQSPTYDADRDTWWRYTDERGISCAQGDLGMSDDSVGTGEDDGDDSASPAPRKNSVGTSDDRSDDSTSPASQPQE